MKDKSLRHLSLCAFIFKRNFYRAHMIFIHEEDPKGAFDRHLSQVLAIEITDRAELFFRHWTYQPSLDWVTEWKCCKVRSCVSIALHSSWTKLILNKYLLIEGFKKKKVIMCLPDLLTLLAVKILLGGELEYYTKGQGEWKQQLPQAGVSAQGCG